MHTVLFGGGSASLAVTTQAVGADPSGTVQASARAAQLEIVLNLNAAGSSAVYGASSHVQPQGITFNVVIVFE